MGTASQMKMRTANLGRSQLSIVVIGVLIASACLALAVHPAAAGARSRPPVDRRHGPQVRLSHRTLTVTGTKRADQIVVRQRPGHSAITRILVDHRRTPLFTVARAKLARIRIKAGAGKDTIAVNLPAHVWSRLPILIAGQAGNDTITAGGGSETVSGGAGTDSVAFTGSRARDELALTATGKHARLTDHAGGVRVTLGGVEHVSIAAGGGADTLTVGDLSPTPVRAITENLAGTPAGGDQTVLDGTGSGDAVAVVQTAGATTVTGLPATVTVLNADSVDTLQIDGLGGDDSFAVAGPGALALQLDGGVGANTASFAVSTAAARLNLAANGPGAVLTSGAATAMSAITTVHFATTGAGDDLTVGDLTGTSVKAVSQDLAGTPSGSDRTTVSATGGADAVAISGGSGSATVTGIPAPVTITHADPAIESLTVDGLGGADTISATALAGGSPPLTIAGGPGDDTLTGSPQGDRFAWNAGDGNDRVEGGAGANTLAFTGASSNDNVLVAPNATHAALTDDIGPIALDLHAIEQIDIAPGGGNDTLTVDDLTGTDVQQVQNDVAAPSGSDQTILNGTAAPDTFSITGGNGVATVAGLTPTVSVIHANPSQDGVTINGLAGADTINAVTMASGGPALALNGDDDNDTIAGGAGDDVVDGGRGTDLADLGAGDDRFVWDPGDGSDTVEGEPGTDTLDFHGANVNENMAVAPNGSRVRFTRDVANITMDLGGIEAIDVSSLAGSDTLNVADMTGTALRTITDDEASAVGGVAPATGAHSVIVNGTGGADNVQIAGSAGSATVSGLTATVGLIHADPTAAALTVNGLAGADTISAAATTSGGVPETINGGDDGDTITGGTGDDVVNGGRGNDVALLGGGNDQFVWNPGDGSDTVDGGPGNDRLTFNGANVNEHFTITPNGQRVQFTRDVANITMDLNALDEIDVASLGGADTMSIGDLSGTGVTRVADNLAALGGGSDGQADAVTVNGTGASDTIFSSDLGSGGVKVTGLATEVDVSGADPGLDTLAPQRPGGRRHDRRDRDDDRVDAAP